MFALVSLLLLVGLICARATSAEGLETKSGCTRVRESEASRSSAGTRYPTPTVRSKIRTSPVLVPSGRRTQPNYGPVWITWWPAVKRSSARLRTQCATGRTTLTHRTINSRMYVVRLLRGADKVEFYSTTLILPNATKQFTSTTGPTRLWWKL